jgi:hypothetical protein
MNRRDFLRVSGLALGGIAASSDSRFSIHLGEPDPACRLLTTPSLDVDVIFMERNYGTIRGDIFVPLIEDALRLASEDCPDDLCALESVEASPREIEKPPPLSTFLDPMPTALLPILAHSINGIRDVAAGYELPGLLLLRPGIDLERDDSRELSWEPASIEPHAGGKIGPYYWRVSLEKHFVGGCIRKNTWHAGALVKYHSTDKIIFNLHLCGWWKKGRPCFGAYESRSGWCRKSCTNNAWQALYSFVFAAALLYVSYWVASALAAAIATSAVGVLVAIPGVPPPP